MSRERVFLAEFSHETNTFASTPTERRDFENRGEFFGREVLAEFEGTNSTVGGACEVAAEEGIDLLPSVSAEATPGGMVSADAYEFYTGRILEDLRSASDVDGVLLSLHGAMVQEGGVDGEGPLVSAVREVVVESVPIVVTLDLHGNVTDELVASADALVAFETYPHVDMAETGRRATELLAGAIRGEVDPVTRIERPPLLPFVPTENTREGPMAELMARARRLERADGVLVTNVLPGFHQAEVPGIGFSVPVVADGDPELARATARSLAETVWSMREAFVVEYPTPGEAVREAKRFQGEVTGESGPIVLADVGDNPGAGGAADGTVLLRELLDQGIANAGLALVRDPQAVDRAIESGVGSRPTITLGGKTDGRHGEPIELEGYVAAVTDGRFRNRGPMATGVSMNLGRTVRLRVGGEGEGPIEVIVTENRVQPYDAEVWRHVGIQPERLDVLVVKSTNHYRASYEPLASEVVTVNSPGLGAMDARLFEYENVERGLYPIEDLDGEAYPDWE
jgi:microcystin degradation protein MlrC